MSVKAIRVVGKTIACYQDTPMSISEIKKNLDSNGHITGNVIISLSNVIDNNIEDFLDIISERLTGSTLLMDVSYKAVCILQNNQIVIQVTGDPSAIIEEQEREAC